MERRSHARIPHTLLKDIPVTFFGERLRQWDTP